MKWSPELDCWRSAFASRFRREGVEANLRAVQVELDAFARAEAAEKVESSTKVSKFYVCIMSV